MGCACHANKKKKKQEEVKDIYFCEDGDCD